ncbi:hypothetical protein PHYSODRAFT_342785 [Phytophthora sojae]|uniref:Glycoside hydrolase 123 catalytic domain-containing protein n=1 Tax=Phytophthora sojae (strain P6497) TaxID=1094619 RepID=G5AHL7_PHYSP|nr:hypothetical protein PHYSODRAFT_342785 [Phytophthora sojae]EGZ04938.1 hypothetical protein PHYSODRAFT_342785 [Phytophthora sojae]|eukprot:XP_009539568.1 hypothetical protein PHYSODRAFT_342785 [Phytophthora sojae]
MAMDRTTQRVRYLRRVSEVEAFIEQFYAHCVALEIADRVRMCADEPRDVAVFHEQLRFMQRLAPNFRIKLAVNHSEFFSPAYAPPQVADYVPLLPLACADLEVTRRLANDARARGGHVCWYVCCGPALPNQFVSSPLVEGELVRYLTFFFELDGFLRWNYCLWPSRPWDDLRWRAPMWKVVDMYFVLPGRDGWSVETLHLESLRFAGQAFKLLVLAQVKLAPTQMQQLQRTVAEQILRSSDLEEFGRCGDRAREDLYSLNPLDYQSDNNRHIQPSQHRFHHPAGARGREVCAGANFVHVERDEDKLKLCTGLHAHGQMKLHGTAEGDWRRLRLGRRQASWCTADSVKIQFGSPKPDVEMTVPVTTTKFSVSLMVVVTAASYTAH